MINKHASGNDESIGLMKTLMKKEKKKIQKICVC